MVRRHLFLAFLLAGCTAHPVSAPTNAVTTAPAAESTSAAPTSAPEPEPEEKGPGCADVAPSSVLSEITGTTVPDAKESRREDMVVCSFGLWEIKFTTGSDEATFAQRRDRHVGVYNTHPTFRELPDFFDEAYLGGEGAESMAHSTLAARQGSAEVWMSWYVTTPPLYPLRDALFGAVFERLG